MKYLKQFEDVNPFYNHNLRMEKGYRPKYRSGLIAVRFQDDEKTFGKKYQDVDEESGQLKVDYQELFSDENPKSDFRKYFEDKYHVKSSKYRFGTDDYYIYFKCEPGKEKEVMEKISKNKIVKDVDYVDVKGIEGSEELQEVSDDLAELSMEYLEVGDEEINKKITNAIERLKKLL